MKTEQLNVRLSPTLLEEIDRLIESGEFGTRVEFVRYAVRMTLKSFEKRLPPPPLIKRPGGRSTSAGRGLRAA